MSLSSAPACLIAAAPASDAGPPRKPSNDGNRTVNLQPDPNSLAIMKFAVGQPVARTEDPILVRGQGRYTDHLTLPGQAYAVMVRSRIAHGVIKGIDISAAAGMPGVLGVYTGADLAAYGPLKTGVPFNNPDAQPLRM